MEIFTSTETIVLLENIFQIKVQDYLCASNDGHISFQIEGHIKLQS